MNFGVFIVLLLNFGLVYFFSGSIYHFVGIFYTAFAILLTLSLKPGESGYYARFFGFVYFHTISNLLFSDTRLLAEMTVILDIYIQ